MRLTFSLLALSLALVIAAPVTVAQSTYEARQARADSLLALPADSLALADLQFIQAVQAERVAAAEDRADEQEEVRRSLGLEIGAVLTLLTGVAVYFLVFKE